MTRLLLIALTALSSCAPVYVPNVRNSPMFTKGGEFQASVQLGNGVEAQSAFAVSEHFGVMTNFAYIDLTDAEDGGDYLRHRFFEGGVGYFTNDEESFFEVFAGYGRGRTSTIDVFDFFGTQTVAATGKYERYFLQPAFGLNKDNINVSFAPRFAVVDFFSFANETNSVPVYEKPKCFLEPAIIGRFNFARNKMFFITQAGASLGLSQEVYFDRRTFQVSAGLGLRLGAMKELVSRL